MNGKRFIKFIMLYSIIVLLLQFILFRMFDNAIIKVLIIAVSAGVVSWLVRDK